MSRIGKMPIAIPDGVTVEFKNGVVTVKGAKGTLSREIAGNIDVTTENGHVVLKALDDTAETNAKHGLYRALLAGMVKGVHDGFSKALEIKGVGWKAQVQGNKFECPTLTDVVVSGISKELVGQTAANIRAVREPEPYHGYGIRYKGEYVEHKEGKTSGKAKK